LNIATFFTEEEEIILTITLLILTLPIGILLTGMELHVTITTPTPEKSVISVIVKAHSMIRDVAGVAIAIEDIQFTIPTKLTKTVMFMFPFWSS
jgi:hypothetical protein